MSTVSLQKSRSRHIIAVSVNPLHTRALSLLLQRFGYQVETAEAGSEAAARIRALRPGLAICDLVLKDMKGMDLLEMLRRDASTAATPVVFMTPPSDAAMENQCMSWGAKACIAKPVQAEELYRTVQNILEPRPRANMRIGARLPVTVNDVPLQCGNEGCLIDLSEQGMHLPMEKPASGKDRISIQLHIRDRTISTEGKVLYSGGTGSRAGGIGLQFVTLEPQDRDFIRKFIREEVTRDIGTATKHR